MSWTRRGLLLAAAAVPGVPAAWWAVNRVPGGRVGLVLDILDRHCGWMDIDPADRVRFAQDEVAHGGPEGVHQLPVGVAADMMRPLASGRPDLAARVAHVEEVVVSRFLLSTDFFPDADVQRRCAYVGYHGPYQHPLGNRLAQFVVQPCGSGDRPL